ncbi:MAG: hypothetical protein RLZZ546_2401 [Bacteroidota bacterium]|jgi:hypothetical protein
MSSEKHISITVGGKAFPITIEIWEEELVRKIEKDLNQRILDYQLKYSNVNLQDVLSMLLFTKHFEFEKLSSIQENFQSQLTQLSDLLSLQEPFSKDSIPSQ